MGVNVFDELNARGMIAQTTNAEKTRELLGGKEPVTFISASTRPRTACTWGILSN